MNQHTDDRDERLEALFTALREDAPTPKPGELDAVLQNAATEGYPLAPIPTPSKKGTRIMTSLLALLAAGTFSYFAFFSSGEHPSSMSLTVTASIQESGKPAGSSSNAPASTDPGLPGPKDDDAVSDSTFKVLQYSQANLSFTEPLELPTDQWYRLGIIRHEDAIYLHQNSQTAVLFPEDTLPSQLYKLDARDTIATPFELFPSFVTDDHGNMLLLSERKRFGKNGTSETFSLPINTPSVIPQLNYYRSETTMSQEDKVDSSATPFLVTLHLTAKVGIMRGDTVVTLRVKYSHEQQQLFRQMLEQLAVKDSTFKLSFGGEAGLKKRFAFTTSMDRKTMNRYERTILSKVDSIAALGLPEKEMIDQEFILLSTARSDTYYPDTVRLKIEQLGRIYSYRKYVLDHAETEKTFAQINTYVPIRIRQATGTLPKEGVDNGLIFWYKPSEELFAVVPQAKASVSSPLRSSMKITVSPNPASFALFAKLSVEKQHSVTIELRDLLGHRVIAPLMRSNLSSGEYPVEFDISSLASGMYLLIVTSDSGEQVVQRVIVKKI